MNESKYTGLTNKEAEKRLGVYGENTLRETGKFNPIKLFLSQFANFFSVILAGAVVISLVIGDRVEALLILLILALNGLLGFWQEYKAEKALLTLKKMAGTMVRVIRSNQQKEIDSRGLVPGDLILVEEGNKIPADAQLIQSLRLEVNEASLTGESLPVAKHHETDGDDQNLFMGTYVVRGRAKAIVTATGMQTRFGTIAGKIANIEEEPTPLATRFERLGKYLGLVAIISAVIVFATGLLRGFSPIEIFLTSLALAVAAVPEGLPAIITITLAVGTQRMAKNGAIVRKLAAIETLGATNVICTDKTGTLTKNKMRVKAIWTKNQNNLLPLVRIAILCNTAHLALKGTGEDVEILGDQTDGALLLLAHDHHVEIDKIKEKGELIDEFSFDSTLKRASVVWREGKNIEVLAKGAPETLLNLSNRILWNDHIIPLTREKRTEVGNQIRLYAEQGLRVIGFGQRQFSQTAENEREDVEKDLVFIGLVGIADPPRSEVKDAILACQEAGIRVVVITGDNILTTTAIAKEIELLEPGDLTIAGDELDALSDEELQSKLTSIRIFARTTPEQKLRIVQAYQKLGLVTAVTGDGVNDALALKQADVGVAMGITGTDVAREASDMVIADDNFASIVKAIEEGRTIYDNILKTVNYLTTCNLGEIIAILGAIILQLPSPLLPLSILWMNLVTDGLPALALALSSEDMSIMKRQPRIKEKHFFTAHTISMTILLAVVMAGITIGVFSLNLVHSLNFARTSAFNTIIAFQLVLTLVFGKAFSVPWHKRRFLWLIIIITVIVQTTITVIPQLRALFL